MKKPLRWHGTTAIKGEASSRPVCRSQSAAPDIRGIAYSQIRRRADHRTPAEPSAAEFSGLVSATAPLEQGKSASTIKTDLSAIRFFHDKMSHPKYTLPDNDALGVELERRRFGQQDRTWTNAEFGKLLGCAMAEGREDYILALYLARYAGLRIHECFRMDTAAAERALREYALTVKGKGGKVRTVPIEDERITMMLQKLLDKTERGHKLLVPDGVPTDRAINGMQQFILRHRDAICDLTAPDRRITFHGLRHTYAAEKYTSLVNGGMTPLDAHFTVSRLLGHERPDVTDIYLASVKGGMSRGE